MSIFFFGLLFLFKLFEEVFKTRRMFPNFYEGWAFDQISLIVENVNRFFFPLMISLNVLKSRFNASCVFCSVRL